MLSYYILIDTAERRSTVGEQGSRDGSIVSSLRGEHGSSYGSIGSTNVMEPQLPFTDQSEEGIRLLYDNS
jgi:hypothetical protein